MKISVFGTGYAGSVTGISLASMNNSVILVDIDQKKVDCINRGKIPFYEPGLQELLKKNRENVYASGDSYSVVKNTDISFICVGTPPNNDGSINLEYVRNVSKEIGAALRGKNTFHTIIMKSTVLPGTIDTIIVPIIEQTSGKKAAYHFGIACVPEFLREGSAVHDFFYPDRIIIGAEDEKTRSIIEQLYGSLTAPKFFCTIKTAEMIKYATNAFLATKISFSNEIGNICKKLGINAYDVFAGVGMDSRINPSFFGCGIGFGGSCFPKDLMALIHFSKSLEIDPNILNSVVITNELQPINIIKILKKHLILPGKTIGVLGLSFKPETDDVRESRAIPVIRMLLEHHAQVVAYDPVAMNNFRKFFPGIHYVSSAEDVLNADAILILTEWKEFEDLDYTGKLVIDGRYVRSIKNKGGTYEGICW